MILSGDALGSMAAPALGGFPGFFAPVAFQTSGQAVFQKLARCAPGDFSRRGAAWRPDNGVCRCAATVGQHSRHSIKMAFRRRDALVEDGVLRRYWTDMRSAAWLGESAPTGEFAGLSIAPGKWRLEDLRSVADGPVYEIVSFSLMLPDPITGDFVAEIRLGYRHDASGVHPIKGGSLSGNVLTAFQDARLSAAIFNDGAYYGPMSIRFGALSIAGE